LRGSLRRELPELWIDPFSNIYRLDFAGLDRD